MMEELKPRDPAKARKRRSARDRAIVNELEKLGKQLIGAAAAALGRATSGESCRTRSLPASAEDRRELGVTLEKASEVEQVQ